MTTCACDYHQYLVAKNPTENGAAFEQHIKNLKQKLLSQLTSLRIHTIT